jgi:hypothetical protein
VSNLTAAKLEDMLRDINRRFPQEANPLLRKPLTYAGIDIYERPPEPPKIQLSDSFEWVTPEARASMNAWLLERFGPGEDLPAMMMVSGMGLVIRHDLRHLIASVTA